MKDIIVIGGGLAGLICSIQLSLKGFTVVLLEKNGYPFHRVCGEYISNEVISYLKSIDCFPEELNPSTITQFKFTSSSGKAASMPLDLGGFGISRFAFDHWLAEKAVKTGVDLRQNTVVDNVQFRDNQFQVTGPNLDVSSNVVIGAFGKRSSLDSNLQRPSFHRRSPFVGVKYHCAIDLPNNEISLHNFPGGYCGVTTVEKEIINICYLVERKVVRKFGDIKTTENEALRKNPHLDHLFRHAEFSWDKPLVVNEISFSSKEVVFEHILMAGDSAGMITPLAGNGMSLAIHGAKLLTNEVSSYLERKIGRSQMEVNYQNLWNHHFKSRLWYGRKIQSLFGNKLSGIAVNLIKKSPLVSRFLMKRTHGNPF